MRCGWLVVGSGRHVDRFALPALARCAGGPAVALCGSDAGRVAELARRHGVGRAGTDLDALLADPAVTHVYVASDTRHHARHVAAAASSGRPVLCEKPLAADPVSARATVETCSELGVPLGTGFHLRHHAAHRQVADLVRAGGIGEPLTARVDYLHAIRPGDGATRRLDTGTSRRGRGVMSGTGEHAVDLIRWLLDDDLCVRSAVLVERDGGTPGGPHRAMVVGASSSAGVAVTITAGRSPYPRNGFSLLGTAGRIEVTGSIGNGGRGTVRLVSEGAERIVEVPDHDVYAAQFDAFVAATRSGARPSASGRDGLAALEVAAAVEDRLVASAGREQ